MFSGALGIDARQLSTFAAELLQPAVAPRRRPWATDADSVVVHVLGLLLELVRSRTSHVGLGPRVWNWCALAQVTCV